MIANAIKRISFKKCNFFINCVQGAEVRSGYAFSDSGRTFGVCKVSRDYWAITELATGLFVTHTSRRRDAIAEVIDFRSALDGFFERDGGATAAKFKEKIAAYLAEHPEAAGTINAGAV